MSLEKTYAMIKPDAVMAGKASEIEQLIEMRGFTIITKATVTLTKTRAMDFYAEHKGKPFYNTLTTFMSSGPIIALCLAKENAILDWRATMGPTNTQKAVEEAPQSLRALYGTDGTMNATHGSDSPESAARELRFFFPKLSLAVPTADEAKEYIAETLEPTLVKGLTALCKEKPSADATLATVWLAQWLLDNNPNKARVVSAADYPIVAADEEDESEFTAAGIAAAEAAAAAGPSAAQIEAMELENAATTVQSHFRGYQSRKDKKRIADAQKAASTAQDVYAETVAADATPAGEPELTPEEAAEQAAAVTKIAAAQRGKAARKEVAAKKAEMESAKAASAEAAQEEAEQAQAATKIAAAQRGRKARKEVAEKRAAKLASEIASGEAGQDA